MREFLCCGFSADELRRINRVYIYMQLMLISDIMSVSCKILDGKYLVQH